MVNEPFHLTDANFEETISKNPIILVDFWAGWCGPCRALAPTIEELSKELAGKIEVVKCNVDENPEVPSKYMVRGIPSLMIFKGGIGWQIVLFPVLLFFAIGRFIRIYSGWGVVYIIKP